MKLEKPVVFAAGAVAMFFAARWVLAAAQKRGLIQTGDAERLQGVSDLYRTSSTQQAVTNAAVAANWRDVTQATASQPDWWI